MTSHKPPLPPVAGQAATSPAVTTPPGAPVYQAPASGVKPPPDLRPRLEDGPMLPEELAYAMAARSQQRAAEAEADRVAALSPWARRYETAVKVILWAFALWVIVLAGAGQYLADHGAALLP